MSLQTGIYKLLTGDPTVAGLVASRVYPSEIPEGSAWPALLYDLPATTREATMETAGVPSAKVSISCFSENVADTTTLANAARNVIADYEGAADNVTILSSVLTESRDGWDYEMSSIGLYFRELTFEIFYRE